MEWYYFIMSSFNKYSMILVDFLQQANSFYNIIAWSFCSFDLPRCDLLTISFFLMTLFATTLHWHCSSSLLSILPYLRLICCPCFCLRRKKQELPRVKRNEANLSSPFDISLRLAKHAHYDELTME